MKVGYWISVTAIHHNTSPADLFKLLVYSEDVDIVYGSRTVRHFIWDNANMGRFLQWGNYFVAKLMELLFNTNYLSDVGCTYRLINRHPLMMMLPKLKVRSNFFGPEMMVRGYLMNFRAIQLPVNYKERIGDSSVTGSLRKAFYLGIEMILLIIAMRFKADKLLLKVIK